MLTAFALMFSSLVVADDAAKSELAPLVKKLEAAASYHYEFLTTSVKEGAEGKPAGGREGGDAAGEGGARDSEPWMVDIQLGKPAHLHHREVEMYRAEKRIAVLDPKGKKWVGMDRGEGKPAEAPKQKGMIGRLVMESERVVLPHLLLKDFASKISDAKHDDKDGQVTLVATLTKEAAREFAGLRPGGKMEGGKGEGGKGEGGKREGGKREGGKPEGGKPEGGKPEAGGATPEGEGTAAAREAECDGTVRFVVANGVITSFESNVVIKGAVSRQVHRSFKLTGVGATVVEPPAEATAALAGS